MCQQQYFPIQTACVLCTYCMQVAPMYCTRMCMLVYMCPQQHFHIRMASVLCTYCMEVAPTLCCTCTCTCTYIHKQHTNSFRIIDDTGNEPCTCRDTSALGRQASHWSSVCTVHHQLTWKCGLMTFQEPP